MDDDSVKKSYKRLAIRDKDIVFYRSSKSASEFNATAMGFHLMVTTGIITKPNSRYVRLFFSDSRARYKSGKLPVYATKLVYKMNGITPLRMIRIAKVIADKLKDIEPRSVKKIKHLDLTLK
jgi:hypothetical protein